jgi:hypothetical protein
MLSLHKVREWERLLRGGSRGKDQTWVWSPLSNPCIKLARINAAKTLKLQLKCGIPPRLKIDLEVAHKPGRPE